MTVTVTFKLMITGIIIIIIIIMIAWPPAGRARAAKFKCSLPGGLESPAQAWVRAPSPEPATGH